MRAPEPLTLCELADAGLPDHESYSPFCLKAHRALRAAGLPYERRHGTHPGAFAALNPAAQVPVLLCGSTPIADSTRILEVVSDLAGAPFDGHLSARERGEAWLFEELGDTALYGFLVAARWADPANWPRTRAAYFAGMPWPLAQVVPAHLRRGVITALRARDVWRAGPEACWARFETLLDRLEARAPTSGFWMGERLSVADLGLFPPLHSLRTPLTPAQAARVAERRRLGAWLDRVDAATRATTGVPRRDPRHAGLAV